MATASNKDYVYIEDYIKNIDKLVATSKFEDFCYKLTDFIAKNGGSALPVFEPKRKSVGFVISNTLESKVSLKREECITNPVFNKSDFRNTRVFDSFASDTNFAMLITELCNEGEKSMLEKAFKAQGAKK